MKIILVLIFALISIVFSSEIAHTYIFYFDKYTPPTESNIPNKKTTVCKIDNYNSISDVEKIPLNGGECNGTKSVEIMKKNGWNIADIKIENTIKLYSPMDFEPKKSMNDYYSERLKNENTELYKSEHFECDKQSDCGPSDVWDCVNKKCVNGCSKKGQIHDVVNDLCVDICIKGTEFNSSTQTCNRPTSKQVVCPNGQFYDYDIRQCKANCPNGQIYDYEIRQCKANCPNGQIYDYEIMRCRTNCKYDQKYDAITRKCKCLYGGRVDHLGNCVNYWQDKAHNYSPGLKQNNFYKPR